MTITGNFIGGKTTFSASNETIPVYDPATGKVVRATSSAVLCVSSRTTFPVAGS
jgi:acyl-CoA reductase-like NAD-dependent aldehyde dehydrogenase